ncbi:AAA family ATPase [Corynebacterium yonathiae]|uniref:AAA family ATPase n=1 Tax=Corynebacterium yonathiae TaxID=2913504 RepID=A0ABU8Y4U4_9CORY
MPSAVNSYQRFLEAADVAGLHYRELESGKRAQVQTPGHSDQDRGTSITYNGDQLLVHCHNGDTGTVLDTLGLSLSDLYDEPSGARYDYGDGRLVHRSPEKYFRQTGNTKGTNLYGLQSLSLPGPVYVVEGEKDVNTANNVWGAAAVSQAQGASTGPDKADWAPLKGRDVVIVADDDKPGEKRADKVFTYLTGLNARPESVRIVKAAAGKDLSDHIAAGLNATDLKSVGDKVGRRRVKLIKASSVKTEKVDWLIKEWIPAGMLTLLAGREGIGKSTIACGWVAEFSNQGMKCAYLNSEDSRSFTVRPRLQAAGANLDNIFFIDVETETGNEGHLRLPQDTEILFRELVDQGVKFVVLDAAKSSMDPKLDGYKDDHVRQFLEPLAAAADKYNITIVGLAHFGKKEGKDTGRLLLGSIAWSQIARSVLSAAVDEDGRLIVTNTKANLARGIVSREARIVPRPVAIDDGTLTELGAIEWGQFTDTPATELLEAQSDEMQDERSEIEAIVLDYLEACGGSAPAGEVLKVTRAAGLNDNAVKKARKKIGVKTERQGFGKGAKWVWAIDAAIGAIDSHARERESMESMRESMTSSTPTSELESTKTGRAIRANTPLGVNNSGPTGPTGDMQGKHDGPTGQKSQSGHGPHTGPTGQLFTLNTSTTPQPNDLEDAVLNALDTTRGQTTKQIQKHLTKQQLDQADDFYTVIERLQMKGLIRINERGLFVRKETA